MDYLNLGNCLTCFYNFHLPSVLVCMQFELQGPSRLIQGSSRGPEFP